MEYQWLIDWVDDRITRQSRTVILLFLVATGVFVTGLGAVETESGQDQFIEDLPSFNALEDVQRDFGASFSESTTTTTLVQDSRNVLSKPSLLRMLRALERIESTNGLRVTDTSSAAETVARTLDPEATTLDEQITAVERATPREIERAVRRADERDPTVSTRLSDDFEYRETAATATEATVTHRAGPGQGEDGGGGPEPGGTYPPNRVERVEFVVDGTAPDIEILGTPPDTIGDTLLIVLPGALFFITLFLIVAYRDPVDLVIGLVAIVMTLVWTFGFLGLAGIPFNVILVTVPPLLIAIGIDFGIHAVNRYREERVEGKDIDTSMRLTTNQVTVAFFIVMGTSAIGFLSNLVSAFPPTQDFGVAATAGILFTFLIFGVFVPATKVWVDRLRERYPIPTVSNTPFSSESSPMGRLLSGGAVVARRAPLVFTLLILVATVGGGVYAADVDSGFDPDDFLPAAETPDYLQVLPEPFRPPAEYEYVQLDDFRDEKFQQDGRVLLYVRGNMERDSALVDIHRAGADPPETFRSEGRRAESQSVVTLIQTRAETDPEFRRVVRRNDADGDGIPDDNLPEVYDALVESAGDERVDQFLSDDRTSALVIYTVDANADNAVVTAEARDVADRFRADASPTGNAVIFDEALGLVLETVIDTLVLTFVGAIGFLLVIYWILEGNASLGVVNAIPIAITVVAVVASMRAFGIKFNAINGSILALVIGLGIDYSVHIVHRFVDEYDDPEMDLEAALRRTVVGTGGALTGSMLTTVSGVGVLALALNPAVGVFGILTALSVFYAYLASVFVLPSILVLWVRYVDAPAGEKLLSTDRWAGRPQESDPEPRD
ncbi:RND transporter [Halobacteriales archaeon QH_10_67_22]|nr:MAG: RND transporter [Halobacteriales archaeon QH_10_67_22]